MSFLVEMLKESTIIVTIGQHLMEMKVWTTDGKKLKMLKHPPNKEELINSALEKITENFYNQIKSSIQ